MKRPLHAEQVRKQNRCFNSVHRERDVWGRYVTGQPDSVVRREPTRGLLNAQQIQTLLGLTRSATTYF